MSRNHYRKRERRPRVWDDSSFIHGFFLTQNFLFFQLVIYFIRKTYKFFSRAYYFCDVHFGRRCSRTWRVLNAFRTGDYIRETIFAASNNRRPQVFRGAGRGGGRNADRVFFFKFPTLMSEIDVIPLHVCLITLYRYCSLLFMRGVFFFIFQ